MTISRRRLIQVSALAPLATWLPRISGAGAMGLGREASATAVPNTGIIVDTASGNGVLGVALDWAGPDTGGVVAEVRPLIDGVWQAAIGVESDRGHGPADPTGRVHGPAVLVPGAEAFRITPLHATTDLRLTEIPDSPGPISTTGLTPEGYTTFDPMPGLSIIERSNWTDRQRHDTIDCWLGSSVNGLGCRADVGIRHGVIHHTVNINSYGPNDVPAMLRGIQRYHMDTRGWDDIGYNFVIDRFGRIWHARAGAIEGSVSGAHTSGLNTESVGVSVLGTFTHTDPGQPVIDALSALLGWKLSRYGVDPLGETVVRSAGGDYTAAGEMILVNNISGHRENQRTACPGSVLFGRIPEIRNAAAELVPVFGHLIPEYGPDAISFSGWAIDRFAPTAIVPLTVTVDQSGSTTLDAGSLHPGLSGRYPDSGDDLHGFAHSVPIDVDTRSIVVTAASTDGHTASLLDLRLFATFIDVEPSKFFSDGVYWMRTNNITTGTQPGLFEPMDEVSRVQMAAFLWRLWDRPSPSTPAPFVDVPLDHPLAEAVAWLAEAGITHGTSANTFSPERFVTRGEMATFIWRMCGTPPHSRPSPFGDVTPSNVFEPAILWLHEVGITTGVTPDRFMPESIITRGEMATFLQRLAVAAEAWTRVDPPPIVVASLATI